MQSEEKIQLEKVDKKRRRSTRSDGRYGPQQRGGRITMEARWRLRIIDMVDKVSGEENGIQARWQICGTTGMDTAAEKMWYSNR